MHLHNINDFIQLHPLTISHYYTSKNNSLFLMLSLIPHLQACPCYYFQKFIIIKFSFIF